MARPPRHNVDYFPHYISDGKKMFVIEAKFGNDGYAAWFKILEILAKTDKHYFDCSDEANLMFLAAKCNVSEERLVEIIDSIVKIGELDEEFWNDHKVLWSDRFVESIQDAYRKRGNQCMSRLELSTIYKSLRQHKPPKFHPKGGENPQSKVKYSIVNETKGEDSENRTREGVTKAVIELITQRGIAENDFPVEKLAYKFFDHYESKGWRVNGDPIVKWRSKLNQWISEHIADPTRLLGKNHGKLTKEQEEEIDIAILKHQRNVLDGNDNIEPSEDNRLRRLP